MNDGEGRKPEGRRNGTTTGVKKESRPLYESIQNIPWLPCGGRAPDDGVCVSLPSEGHPILWNMKVASRATAATVLAYQSEVESSPSRR